MAKTFVDPQCESSMDIDPMDVECPLMSRAGLESIIQPSLMLKKTFVDP